MAKNRPYLKYTEEAVTLLARQIKLGRKQKKWTEHNLAERAGISRATLQKIERGDLGCAIGLVFEVATLVDIQLFQSDHTPLRQQLTEANEKIALLPKHTHSPKRPIDDDF